MRTTKHNLPKRIHISHCIGYREQVQEKEAYRAGILINDKNLHIVLYTGKGNAVTQHGNVRSFLAVNLHKSIRSIYNSDRSKHVHSETAVKPHLVQAAGTFRESRQQDIRYSEEEGKTCSDSGETDHRKRWTW